ncbi:hypothetical protein CLM62_12755 [Streptomyces sp. SA15]|uniref:hypothetical protein n=1 Tax=Streptomyces sp. SA15 TaxID=934019 RepID=UPI000BAE7DCE|nr:hypothetical protein [Streptomyces sp. SA15]PAZ15660.1 hypothetical protein CLM62_12755 [Streptomyces sp. SA15]
MCRTEPTIYGMTPRIADEIGRDDAPTCCSDEMGRKDTSRDHIEYTCGCCGTVLEVDDLGLVWDIREKAAA